MKKRKETHTHTHTQHQHPPIFFTMKQNYVNTDSSDKIYYAYKTRGVSPINIYIYIYIYNFS